jgi:hypothetical protein
MRVLHGHLTLGALFLTRSLYKLTQTATLAILLAVVFLSGHSLGTSS